MTFGRKGLEPGAIQPAQRQPLAARNEDLQQPSEQVAAFLAQERQRVAAGEAGYAEPGRDYHASAAVEAQAGRPASAASGGPPKSMALAYVLWWFVYPFSAHRFYLGDKAGGIKQCAGFIGSLLVIGIGISLKFTALSVLAGIVFCFTLLWIIADLFFIPGLCRAANARIEAEQRVFS
jgi:hypothetical protein